MFRLLYGRLDQPSQLRKSIATSLIESADDVLDDVARKVRTMCMHELNHVAKTGILPAGSLLHGILAITALHLKMDAGELESVNSQIKSTIEQGSTMMSLELLSSRVNSRKTITMAVNGDTRLKHVKKLAEQLASTSTLYRGMESSVLMDSDRWAPPPPLQMTTMKADVCMKLTSSEKWAVKYNSLLMKALRHHQSKNASALTFGFVITYPTHESLHMVAEITGRTCHSQRLEHAIVSGASNVGLHEDRCQVLVDAQGCDDGHFVRQKLWWLPTEFQFTPSLTVLSDTFTDVEHSNKSGINIILVELKLCHPADSLRQGRIQYVVGRSFFVATMYKRRPYTKKTNWNTHVTGPEVIENHAGDDTIDGIAGANMDTFDVDAADIQDDLEIEALERELAGNFDDVLTELEQELKADEQGNDLFDLDEMNTKFVARAMSKQVESPFMDEDKIGNTRSDTIPNLDIDNDRSFEDVLGEELLQFLLEQEPGNGDEPRENPSGTSEPSLARPVVQNLDESTINVALTHWMTALKSSFESCQTMSDGLRGFEGNRPEATLGHELTLLVHSNPCDVQRGDDEAFSSCISEVSLVSWVKPFSKLQGRVVTLDEHNRVVYPSHFVPKQQFGNALVILPCSGARVRKQDREEVSSVVVRLQKMFSVALTSDDLAKELDFDDSHHSLCASCIACGGDSSAGPLKQCACCLLWWHQSCEHQVLTYVGGFTRAHEVQLLCDTDMTISDMPFVFMSETELLIMRVDWGMNHIDELRQQNLL